LGHFVETVMQVLDGLMGKVKKNTEGIVDIS
jgi:hypothetical protein